MLTPRFFANACIAFAGLTAALSCGPAGAQTYPARDLTFIVAFAPGGVADTVARLVGQGRNPAQRSERQRRCRHW